MLVKYAPDSSHVIDFKFKTIWLKLSICSDRTQESASIKVKNNSFAYDDVEKPLRTGRYMGVWDTGKIAQTFENQGMWKFREEIFYETGWV